MGVDLANEPTDRLVRRAEADPAGAGAVLRVLAARSRHEDWSRDDASIGDQFVELFPMGANAIEYPFDLPRSFDPLRSFGPRAVAYLLGDLDDESMPAQISWFATLALAEFPAYAAPISTALVQHLGHAHGIVRRQVRWVLRLLAPASTDALSRALHAGPESATLLLDALAFQGLRAAHVADVLADLRGALPKAELPALEEALDALRGIAPSDPDQPIPYLGEELRFGSTAAIDDDTPAHRRDYDRRVWSDMVSSFARDNIPFGVLAYEPGVWTPELELAAQQRLDSWQPERVVVARRSVELSMYDGRTQQMVTQVIDADAAAGFTMGELLFKVQRTHDEQVRDDDRIFEGLRRDAPGRYYIRTGS